MPIAKPKAKKAAHAHVMKGHAALKKAVRKLIVARVLKNRGKTERATRMTKLGQRTLRRAVSHYTRAAHTKAKVKSRLKPARRGGSGGGLGGILGGLGGVLGGILGGI